ncbi:DUF2256 domain-containing protein [Mucilaginibacter sp. HMF7410]|uniref:DUF2256 domain-containing protein n=2 Tax=Mucilaginibacter arboris TaxID=2682090 RepID=A0A7K1SWK8_9SPHI|nr:DUF2256 domain-containing protein [Mucilaginibacter arboris]
MPETKRYTKSTLPSKTCVVCKRPFEWRKKWGKCWEEVKYCSERCRKAK